MTFPSYIFDAAPLSGTQIVVVRSNPQNLKGDILEIWDAAAGERRREIRTESTLTLCVAASTVAGIAVTGNSKGVLQVWSVAEEKSPQTVALKSDRPVAAVAALDLLDHGRHALVASGSVVLWDLATGRQLRDYGEASQGVLGLCVLPGEARFLSASCDRSVRLWDSASGACLRTFIEADLPLFVPRNEALDAQAATGVCVLPDGRRAVSSHGDGMLRCWNIETGELLQKARAAKGKPAWLLSVAASREEDKVIAGSWDNNLWLWEPGSKPVSLSGHIGEAGPAFFLDRRLAVSVSFDQTIRVWDTERHECVRVIGKAVKSSRWPPDESMY